MEIPELSLGWVAFLVVFIGSVGAALLLVFQEIRTSREKDILFKQAAKERDLSPPIKEIHEYEEKRHALFVKLLHEQKVRSDAEEDLLEGQTPENSWLRIFLEPEDRKALKLLLLRRALANAPRWIYLSGENTAKYRLYKHGLLTESAWLSFQNSQEELNKELQYIKLEAECIEQDWGASILRDAIMLHRLAEAQRERAKQQETELRRQEKEKDRLAREKEREKEQRDHKELQKIKKAEKLREQLLKEEEQKAPTTTQRKNSK